MYFRLGIMLAFTALLSACNTIPTPNLGTLSAPVTDKKGAVVLNVAISSRTIGNGIPHFTYITLTDTKAAEKQYQLTVVQSEQTFTTTSFAGVLPIGEYYVQSIGASWQIGNMIRTVSMQPGREFGTFAIASKRLTDLGTMIFAPDPSTVSTLAYGYSGIRHQVLKTRINSPLSALNGKKAEYAKQLTAINTDAPLGWTTETDTAWVVALAKRQAVATSGWTADRNGNLLFPTRLGQIRRRDGAGNWQSFDTGTIHSLYNVSHGQDGRYVALSEYGDILSTTKLGEKWSSQSFNQPAQRLYYAGSFADGTLYVLAQSRRTDLSLFVSDGNGWKELHTIPLNSILSPTAVVSEVDSKLYVLVPGVSLSILDLTTRQIERQKSGLDNFYYNGAGMFVGLISHAFSRDEQFISQDQGRTWAAINSQAFAPKTPIPQQFPVYFDNRLYAQAKAVQDSTFSSSRIWLSTADLGKTWEQASQFKQPQCEAENSPYFYTVGNSLLQICPLAVYRLDPGKDWEVEWNPLK